MQPGRVVSLAVLALLVIVFGGGWLVDYAAASSVQLNVTISPSVLPADGQSTGTVTILVRQANGTPRVGDTIEVLDEGPGVFDRTRGFTDKHGQISFGFTTGKSNIYQPAAPVPVLVTDTSMGRLVEIDKMVTVHINVVDPSKMKKGP